MILSMFRRYPVTIAITVLALIAAVFPTLSNLFELNFGLATDGQWWRWISGHWTHFDSSHLFWDLTMFIVLSAACEHRHRRWYGAAIITSLLFISAAIAITCPSIGTYRGLSGIDTGLFVWFVVDRIKSSLVEGDKIIAATSSLAIVGLLGKLIFEAVTGATLFVDSSTFIPLVQSHLAGVICGVAFGLLGLHQYRGKAVAQESVVAA